MESGAFSTLDSSSSIPEPTTSPTKSSLENGQSKTEATDFLTNVFMPPEHDSQVIEQVPSSAPELDTNTMLTEESSVSVENFKTPTDSTLSPSEQAEPFAEVQKATAEQTVDQVERKVAGEDELEKRGEETSKEVSSNATEEESKQESTSEQTADQQVEAAEPVEIIKVGPDLSLPCCDRKPKPKNEEPPMQSLHHVKWIEWKETRTPIITQNENGPCPLVAIINVLLLRGKVKLASSVEVLTASKLMEYLGNAVLENTPQNVSSEVQLNYEQNMHDAMAVLPKLQTGLDVNVKFTGVRDFEYTPECIIFDLLNINLYHGWLTDPESPEIQASIGHLGYNQLVEKIITQKSSSNTAEVTEALIAENFLERTASQLTYHGLSELASTMPDGELAILFRNNHFSTIYKHKGEILQLATDQGFLTELSVVWETLVNIEGDGEFVDARFCTIAPQAQSVRAKEPLQQVDQDYLVALSLQQEQLQTPEVEPSEITKSQQELNDEFLARHLEEEDRKRASLESQAQGTTGQRNRDKPQKKESCTVL